MIHHLLCHSCVFHIEPTPFAESGKPSRAQTALTRTARGRVCPTPRTEHPVRAQRLLLVKTVVATRTPIARFGFVKLLRHSPHQADEPHSSPLCGAPCNSSALCGAPSHSAKLFTSGFITYGFPSAIRPPQVANKPHIIRTSYSGRNSSLQRRKERLSGEPHGEGNNGEERSADRRRPFQAGSRLRRKGAYRFYKIHEDYEQKSDRYPYIDGDVIHYQLDSANRQRKEPRHPVKRFRPFARCIAHHRQSPLSRSLLPKPDICQSGSGFIG